jgi:hypothetical protein
MRASLAALCVLAVSLAIALPAAGALGLQDCSPIPTVLRLQCPDVPGAGAVGITSVPGVGVFVAVSGTMSCGPAQLPVATTSVTVTCTAAGACAAPFAFGAVDDLVGTITTTASCGGGPGSSASCSTQPFPNNFCMSAIPGIAAGTFPFTCTVTPGAGSTLQDFTWWAECAQPIG